MKLEKIIWKVYMHVYDAVLLRFHPYLQQLARVREALGAQDGWRVLDAACGTGNFMQMLANAPEKISLVGIDFERAALRRARDKLGGNEKVTLQEGNLDFPLPFADGEFDAVVCINALYSLADPSQFIRECRRVLKAEGKLILITPPEQPRMGPVFKEHIRTMQKKYRRLWFFYFAGQILRIAPSLLLFLLINLMIQGHHAFKFFSKEDLTFLVCSYGFVVKRVEMTYGGQTWFLECVKPAVTALLAGKGA